MSEFTQLSDWYTPLPRPNWWSRPRFQSTKTVSWEMGKKGSGMWLSVPAGYPFDVSIPSVLWWLLSPSDPRFLKAACLHDYALHDEHWDRVTSAAAFSEALKAKKVGKWTRLVMVISVIFWNWK